jgi:cell division protein ZapA (FtsZ GTPase activity inhibitor)
MTNNRVKIEVLGTSYTISTPEGAEYVRSIARELNTQISGLMDADKRLSPNAALILCAMGYADSLRKSEESADHMRAQLTDYLEDAARARLELDDAKRELGKLRRQFELMQKMGAGQPTPQ